MPCGSDLLYLGTDVRTSGWHSRNPLVIPADSRPDHEFVFPLHEKIRNIICIDYRALRMLAHSRIQRRKSHRSAIQISLMIAEGIDMKEHPALA